MQQFITVPTIVDGLSALGVRRGAKLFVHCSMSSLGHVQGGAQTIVEAILTHIGELGTVVMPTSTNGRFDPSEWGNPPVPEELWDRIRFETPLYHPQKTPTDDTMSAVYELFRSWPEVIRTNHPHSSVAAWGADRDKIVAIHRLDERFGNSSPLGAMYELDAEVLFVGTTYATNTCFHLAEYRRPNPPLRKFMIVRDFEGKRKLVTYKDVDTDSSIFDAIGSDFEAVNSVRVGQIGAAICKLFSLRSAVDFAVDWLSERER